MANTEVGTIASTSSVAPTTLTLPAGQAAPIGAVRVFRSSVVSSTVAPSALSGGNVAAGTWTQGFGPTNDNQGTVRRHSIWFGTVANANGSQHETITVTWSGSITGVTVDLDCVTIDPANTSASWTQDGSALTLKNNTSSTTITYPAATSSGTGRVYVGFARASSGGAYGNPSGGTTESDVNGNPAINLLAVGSGAITPTHTSNATISNTAGILLVPSAAVVNTKTLSATATGTAGLQKTVVKALSATSTPTPAVSKLVETSKAVTATGTPGLRKVVSKALGATVTGTAALSKVRVVVQALSAVVTGTAGLVKLVCKPLAGTTTGAPGLAKLVKARRSATVTGTGALVRLRIGLAALPTLLVDGAWTTDPLSAAPAWTPIPKCRALKLIGNHRSAALGRFDAGTSEATFSNANRALEPLFAAGPNFPNIRTRKRMRFRAQNASTTYERGHTYVESVKPGYGGQWKDSAVTIYGADAFSLFARMPLRSPYDAAVLAFGARPYYRLNEPAGATLIMDESGSGLNATALGPVVKPADTTGLGAITAPLAPPILDGGTAIQFIATPLDAGGNYLDAGSAPAIIGTGAFSVALWVCWPETVYLDTFYCGQWAGDSIGVGTGWYISSQPSGFDGQIFWVTQDPSATRSVASSGSGINLSDGQWHLILAGRDGAGNLGVWFDAIAAGTAAGAASNLVAAPVWVGNVHSQIATYSGVKLWMGKFAMFPGVAPSLAMAQAIYAARTCWDGQSSDTRVAALLNYANWPAADRDLDAGVARLTDAGDLASRKLLDALRDTDATEGGCLTVARDNKIMLRNRRAIQGARAASTTSQATFGDRSDLGEIGWSDLKLSFDDVELANHVTITRRNGITAIALDAAAIAASGTPIDHAQVSLSNSDLDATSQAQWVLALLENPNRWRVDSITVPLLGNNTAQQDAVLSREKWERITVAFTPPLGGGARILQDNLIVGIDDDVKAGAHWDVIFHLTATDLQLNPFILGTSLLGSSDVLVF